MSALMAIGVNHETAPIQLREKVAFDPAKLPEVLHDFRQSTNVDEAAILSTCNRTELYFHSTDDTIELATRWLSKVHALTYDELLHHLYQHPDAAAVRHVMRVASGLDSLVLGEPQILGQVKEAYHQAQDAGTAGKVLSRLFQKTFSVAKSVRTDTDIGKNPISVSFASVSLAKQVFGQLEKYNALLIGAGETIELTAKHLHEQSVGSLTIANRTLARAHNIADPLNGAAISLSSIPAQLEKADIVITATNAPDLLITRAMVEKAQKQRHHRPILLIDLAVPRNIDPKIDQLSDTFVYSVDDLRAIIADNVKSRQSAASMAENIIDEHANDFLLWLKRQSQVKHIRQLRAHGEEVTEKLLAHSISRIRNGEDPEEVLKRFGHSLNQQLMHGPTTYLNQAINDQDDNAITRLLNAYSKLDH